MAFSFQSSSFISLVIEGVLYGFVTLQGPEEGAYLADSSDVYSTIKAVSYILESIIGDAILVNLLDVKLATRINVMNALDLPVLPGNPSSRSNWGAAEGFDSSRDKRNRVDGGIVRKLGICGVCLFACHRFGPYLFVKFFLFFFGVADGLFEGLLSYKLWKTRRSSARHVLIPLIHIILECGIIYSLSLITFMVVIAFNSYASYVVFNFLLAQHDVVNRWGKLPLLLST
ncbi:hypothetical protein CONPUDRAFT_141395 [Coniophora puteana RWD-64-598 SS2]|uniref:Uncharacterized protein n=1 Tax=Coniophora puteana (strain RWD-64-598) TaxID=741705 RepID=A0A5M3N8I4_CONPW|nr:uncharacterized protein CONPUDRAFT_141395 [Coniophora puteana RWD-64-598 SS2]EIW87155.1 hypothetical protein CONPUDRAFT_141395 [Coniophora puteana RWD-64-598 SS2]